MNSSAVTGLSAADGMRFQVLEEWRERLFAEGEFLAPSCVAGEQEIKRTKSRRVRRVGLRDGTHVVVKEYPHRTGIDGLVWPWSNAPMSDPEWLMGRAARAAGLPVPEPLAVGVRPVALGFKRDRVLVTRAVEGARDLADLRRSGTLEAGDRRALAVALGRLAHRMHAAGLYPDDPHAGNFLVSGRGSETELHALDLRMPIQEREVSEARARENLLEFYGTFGVLVGRTDRLRFLMAYAADRDRSNLLELARFLERESVPRVRAYLLERSRAALRTNRRFSVHRDAGIAWHVRTRESRQDLFEILSDPEAPFREPEQLLKGGNSSTVVARGRYVIKRDNYKRPSRRLLDLVRPGRSLRALRRSFHLEISGLPTPRALAAGKWRRGLLVRRGYLVVDRLVAARTVDGALAGARDGARLELLDQAGALAARLHERGFRHRDLKAGNLLVDGDGRLWLVDLDGVRPEPCPSLGQRASDLQRLLRDLRQRGGLVQAEEQRLLQAYERETGRGAHVAGQPAASGAPVSAASLARELEQLAAAGG